jgi:hypothetical protein
MLVRRLVYNFDVGLADAHARQHNSLGLSGEDLSWRDFVKVDDMSRQFSSGCC